jgi:hypothetical protein
MKNMFQIFFKKTIMAYFQVEYTAMITRKEFHSSQHTPFQKALLYFLLLASGASMLLPVVWINHKIKTELGTNISEMALTYQIVFLLGFVSIGFIFAFFIEISIRKQGTIFSSSQVGSWSERIATWWGYELIAEEAPARIVLTSDTIPEADNIEELINRPRRRGRKPVFPLDRWLPIAAKWESRDSIRDAFTLGELIAEHLGTNPDGSPVVSEQAYYSTWRKRALEELQERARKKVNKPLQ